MQGRWRYNPLPVPTTQLYFAYTAFLDPDRINRAAPGATFCFTAHYPETGLAFVKSGSGTVATLTVDAGSTVWGAVFEIPLDQIGPLKAAEKREGRIPGWDMRAIDREGNKHDCLTFVSPVTANGRHRPEPEYLQAMIEGARHWKLPAGWVVGLEDLDEDPLLA